MGVLQTMDTGDVRVGKCREELGLPLEPREALGVVRELRRQEFDGDLASELRVARSIDLAHAACAERRHDLVPTERAAGVETHRLSGRRVF